MFGSKECSRGGNKEKTELSIQALNKQNVAKLRKKHGEPVPLSGNPVTLFAFAHIAGSVLIMRRRSRAMDQRGGCTGIQKNRVED